MKLLYLFIVIPFMSAVTGLNPGESNSFLSFQTSEFGSLMHSQEMAPYCSFTIYDGPNKGTYEVQFDERDGFWYHDFENEQYVIEINGENDIHVMIILENVGLGKHKFSMEMQVAIDMSLNGGEDYFTLDNYRENEGGFIEVLENEDGYLKGGFQGLFGDGSIDEDIPINMEGSFLVKLDNMED